MTANERVSVNAHLAACPACFEETEAVRAMGAFLRERGPAAMPTHVPAPDLWDRIESRMVTEQRESRRSFSMRPVLLFAPALAAIAVAVVLMPKASVSPASKASDSTSSQKEAGPRMANASGTVASTATATVMMDEDRTSRSAPVAPLLAARPLMERAKSQQPPTRIAMVEKLRGRMPTSVAFRRTQSAGFVRTGKVVLAPRDSSRARAASLPAPHPKPEFATITIVDVDTKPAPTMVASAFLGTSAPRPVAPSSSEGESRHMATLPDVTSKTITIVESNAGAGVSTTAYTPPPVTDTMNRQRQRLGLFRGYGASGATMGVLPGASGMGSGSGTASPW